MRALELVTHTGSARVDKRVQRIGNVLKPYKSIPKVADFFDLYRDKSATNAS